MIVSLSPNARQDLKDIGDYISERNSDAANVFVNQILDRCDAIAITPEGYPERPSLGNNIRSVTYKSHIIFYSLQDNHIRIERILHGRMNYSETDFSTQ